MTCAPSYRNRDALTSYNARKNTLYIFVLFFHLKYCLAVLILSNKKVSCCFYDRKTHPKSKTWLTFWAILKKKKKLNFLLNLGIDNDNSVDVCSSKCSGFEWLEKKKLVAACTLALVLVPVSWKKLSNDSFVCSTFFVNFQFLQCLAILVVPSFVQLYWPIYQVDTQFVNFFKNKLY